MWDLPRPGLKLVSPALAGGFLTTAPPGRPQLQSFYIWKVLFGDSVSSSKRKSEIVPSRKLPKKEEKNAHVEEIE